MKPDDEDPVAVPTSVPAGHELSDTGAGATIGLVGLALAVAGGAILLGRRMVNHS